MYPTLMTGHYGNQMICLQLQQLKRVRSTYLLDQDKFSLESRGIKVLDHQLKIPSLDGKVEVNPLVIPHPHSENYHSIYKNIP